VVKTFQPNKFQLQKASAIAEARKIKTTIDYLINNAAYSSVLLYAHTLTCSPEYKAASHDAAFSITVDYS
jgi:hypothetical protein